MERSIYFIRCSLTGATKIGIADDVLKRKRELQTANPGELTIVGCVPGSRDTESAYHRQFAEKRLAGEWFRLDDDDIAAIKLHPGFREVDAPSAATIRAQRKAVKEATAEQGADFYMDDDDEPWVAIERSGIAPFIAAHDGLAMLYQRNRAYLKLASVVSWHTFNHGGDSPWCGDTLDAATGVLARLRRGEYVVVSR